MQGTLHGLNPGANVLNRPANADANGTIADAEICNGALFFAESSERHNSKENLVDVSFVPLNDCTVRSAQSSSGTGGVPRMLRDVVLNDYVTPEDAEVDSGEETMEDEEGQDQLLTFVEDQVEEHGVVDLDYLANEHFLSSLAVPWEIVYPVQIRSRVEIPTLDTRDPKSKTKNEHYSATTFQFSFKEKRYKMRMELNKNLLSQGLKQKRNVDETTQIIEESDLENCFYQGYVRRSPDSLVAVSTCEGLSGIIRLQNESYIIRPLKPSTDGNKTHHPHVIFNARSAANLECSNEQGMWQAYRELHIGEFLRKMKIAKAKSEEWDLFSEPKFVEVALVADHTLYGMLNSSVVETVKYLAEVVNIADAYLKPSTIHLTLVLVEVWDLRDMMDVRQNVRETLTEFLEYRKTTMGVFGIDAALLVTGVTLNDNSLGMSIPDSICTERAVAVTRDPAPFLDPLQLASGLLHMLSHSLGLQHETPASVESDGVCECSDWFNCVMAVNPLGATSEHPRSFAGCSAREMNLALLGGLGSCLLKEPLEASYEQTCGNGIVERGEECDCRDEEECRYKDPCCDPSTCLLKSWATCRYGDCCYNCTVLSSDYMCRAPLTECDVPEYCSGNSGLCPENALFQDGQPCRDGESYCYRGLCHTYTDQCQNIWGAGSLSSDDHCFETFNPAGRFNGHCGLNFTTEEFIKCSADHVKCGLLHCAGGGDAPHQGNEKSFSKTTVVLEGIEYQCKNLNSQTNGLSLPQLGMVEDGTKCGESSLCVQSKCVALTDIIRSECPKGPNGVTCSGRGVCTSEVRCFCHLDFTGDDCSVIKNITTIRSTTPLPPTTPYAVLNATVLPPQQGKTTEVESVPIKEGLVSVQWLVIVLACGAGGALFICFCCFLCYRRKTPGRRKKKHKKFGSALSFSSSGSKKTEEINQELAANRLISFGNMPSYRADKIRKLVRHSMHHSGSESEHSHRDRDSVEIKLTQTLPITRPPPERGILKKYPRSSDDLAETEPLQRKRMPSSPRMGTRSRGAYQVATPEVPSTDDPIEFIDDKGDGASEDNMSSDDNETHAKEMVSSEDSIEGAKSKILKLKNINDLLKQIDDQFNSVLKQTEAPSPAHSGCSSEPEADRQFARDSFYKQSDNEDGPPCEDPPPVPSGQSTPKRGLTPHGSPTPCVAAVPYRGIKSNPGSPAAMCRSADEAYQRPSPPSSASPKSLFGRNSPRLSKLTHPLFDGYPFKKRASPSNDGLSTSDGYHSDPSSLHPMRKPTELRFTPDPNGAYTKAPGSPGSPEDLEV
ncbi:hypothetical protein CAPTEDRAFT_221935 [Capitella teleta]|uniref:Peptidase M12B domain-containing protein n=1 Tax=Capitella teleta TaxID=283909 RepID=R7VG35_CAPTE|nr:hypothetical protein CAPTEDRAFT_221935 [Capitella teleta]|eukprot:ELU17803.1 hypothetical protein CAPTEDRAFT_221935 [Capitella teleta]